MGGFVGSEYPNKALDGQISDIMFFKQHVHHVVALALANKLDDGNYKRKKVIYSLIPAFLAIAYGAISTPAIMSALEGLTEDPLPSLQNVVNTISELVGKPARSGVQVSRKDIGINEEYPIVIDVGGEGPLDHHGLAAGFESAINVNTKDYVEVGGRAYIPISNLILVRSQGSGPDSYPTLPFADNFADIVTMVGRPLDLPTTNEIVRIIKSTGTINIWTDESFLPLLEDMAKKLKSYVCTPNGLDRFVAGGNAFPKRWQIIANKDGNHSM
ncbi:hypothetical protein SERLA73DRAFT_181294 [Serpula lacrymans var. lacrymans S7.3]|uniref:Uncharacterized protein n=2 Tax=Serpula lacrymans var. lacrymans TaxID=341189 RepID=F8PXT2_SERL3|nr:uncharacterized protein SERLADRAFT_467381 [Serpula lacrymans var. lacrymans S7.9]EGN98695.1 hypothetical protein SERLA73DRAFT_181294 [Serpula lacrymans var. lacrymans S7.3]EGO24300.1 hypothetical protein SERLADRAFT_467381 [Serpula lacrymans var. lacrymans S7.9]